MMSKASVELNFRPAASARLLDKYAVVPISACVFALIASPLLIHFLNPPPYTLQSIMEPRPENRIFWPAIAAISIALTVRNRSRLPPNWPPHIICLLAYLAWAGASVVWAFKPEITFVRFVQQAMIIS